MSVLDIQWCIWGKGLARSKFHPHHTNGFFCFLSDTIILATQDHILLLNIICNCKIDFLEIYFIMNVFDFLRLLCEEKILCFLNQIFEPLPSIKNSWFHTWYHRINTYFLHRDTRSWAHLWTSLGNALWQIWNQPDCGWCLSRPVRSQPKGQDSEHTCTSLSWDE